MSRTRFHIVVIGGWLLAVLSSLGLRLAFGGAPGSVTEGVAWVLLAGVPAIILIMTFRGRPPQTIAEVLYDAERAQVPAPVSRPESADAPRT